MGTDRLSKEEHTRFNSIDINDKNFPQINKTPTLTMKFILSAVVATLAGFTNADFNQIQSSIAGLVANLSSPQQRVFTGQMATAVDDLNEYGCWCYFYDLH